MATTLRAVLLALALLVPGSQTLFVESAAAAPCDPPVVNEIVCENSKPGNPPSEWDVSGAGSSSIQGFSTDISVDQGETVHFKVDTNAADYRLDIYRMGYYGGSGARKVVTVQPSASLPQNQPACGGDPSIGLIDCGNWSESASWAVPEDAVSGIYFAKLVREDGTPGASHIVFVVRDDDGESDLLFQSSDTTWQAYNQYGGNSLYVGGPGTNPGRAYAVSYNRPLTTRGTTPEDAPFNSEYPMVRWLERNGYDVSYSTGVDTDRRGEELLEHDVFLSVGHDEYWSAQQRANVEAARDAGVHLAFFSGNELFWKTRWEESVEGPETDYRTLVCYKETHADAKVDPEDDTWTGTWRDPRFSPPADGGRPENQLSGTIFMVNSGTTAIRVPAADGRMRFWRNTSISALEPGQTATLADETLGYEWDEDLDNGSRPQGLIRLSSTTEGVSQRLLDQGSNYGPGTATHHLTLYRAPSGALVFGAGTIQWSWGLDGNHDRGGSGPDSRMQQATVNLLADMGVQPGTLQAGLVPAAQSTDSTPPSATIGSPPAGEVQVGQTTLISGTASDDEGEGGGGEVGAVEISVDEGETWHPAEGRDTWSYSWAPTELGPTTILARAVDDSGNIQGTPDQVELEVVEGTCPCSIWNEALTAQQDPDTNSVETGVKFRADVPGYVTGLRFYKTAGNGGSHIGHLWTGGGTHLGEVTFTGETAVGWQTAIFDAPLAIEPNTTYVASYHSQNGHYASIPGYFALVGVDNPPLHALADGVDGPNGVYQYGPSGGLFSNGGPSTFNSENYLVDVVFDDDLEPDSTPPKINGRSPSPNAIDVSTSASVSATFNEAMDAGTIGGATVQLRDAQGDLVPASVTYDAAQRRVTLDPDTALEFSTTYTVTVKGGPGGVADLTGNPLAADDSWTFTTAAPPPPPPDQGPGGPILVITHSENPFGRYYTEILRAEGLNEFIATDISNLSAGTLESHDVAILAEGNLNAAQAQMLGEWVQAGGNLIAMRPDPDLAGLLGLTSAGGSLSDAYLQFDTSDSPGSGIVGETIQFHGAADRYTLNGAEAVAMLFSDATTPTANPAVTIRSVGSNGGQAAAFTYDLARSIVYTRQGNPAWQAQERDGIGPIRSDDLFFGAKAGDLQPDWIDFDKVAIPQADEQQRLLTNLIGEMNLDRKPLPRFWFLPRDEKAAVVMTGDDHAGGGTAGRFENFMALDPPGCDVASWECVRATSYIYPHTPITDAKASELSAKGFEIALHAWTSCDNWDSQSELDSFYDEQLEAFSVNFPSLPAPATNRTHCIVWSDWATQAKVELANGIRLDTNYYYWPGSWVQNRPGMFTGSGMPMRFADLDGSLIDVYQAPTQMTDESEQSYPFTAEELLDRALGPEGYYGVFTANMHTDSAVLPDSDAIVAAARSRDVPVVSARQMLTWLDGRNQSSFGSIEWTDGKLNFEILPAEGAIGLRAMVPTSSEVGDLIAVRRNGIPIETTTRTVKGVEYSFFDALPGNYTADYSDEAPPVISDVAATVGADGTATITWTTDEAAESRVDYGTSPDALVLSASDPVPVVQHSVQLSGLQPNTVYHFRVTSADTGGNSTTAPGPLLSPEVFRTPPPAPLLSETIPPSPANANNPLVVGSAEPGTTVRIHIGGDCSTAPVATGTAAELSTGIGVAVPDDSSNSFRATATSESAESACSAPLTYLEDSTGPETALTQQPPALTNSAAASFEFTGTDAGSGLGGFQCRLDSSDEGAWAACTSPRNLSDLDDGAHSFEVRAIDNAGNTDQAPASFNWTVDTTAADTQITKQPPALTNSAAASFEFTGTDAGSGLGGFQCRLDSEDEGAWAACTSPRNLSDLDDGAHKFEVRAIDQAGNTDQTPASFNWTVDTTPPTVSIDALSKDLLAAGQSAELTWHADENGAFELRVGGTDCQSGAVIASGDYTTQPETRTSEVEAADLAEGQNTLRLCLTDAAGNRASATATIRKDTTAPDTQIDSAPPALTDSAAASFEFSGTDSGSGIASFECRIDSDQSSDWQACTSPRNLSDLEDGNHNFEVRAVDNAGNADQSPASFEWTVDTTAPDTQIDSGPPALTNSAAASFAFSGTDSGSGVASFQCRLDSSDEGAWAACTSPRNLSDLEDGTHSFEVRAIDNAGNTDQAPASFNWTVDTTAPDTQITKQPPALTNSAAASFEFTGTDAGSGLGGFQCRLDSEDEGAWAACTSPRNLSDLDDGAHKFEVRAIDNAGNTDQSPASFNWTVDATAPGTTIESTPPAISSSANASFKFSATDAVSGVASFECRRDSSADEDWQPCVSPINYTSLAEGLHTFEVRAIDNAGNADQSPASFTWTIDTIAPDTQITKQPPALINSAAADFEFSGTDAGGSGVASFQCRIDSEDSEAWQACTSPKTYAGLSDGAHSFEVRAVDNAGNTDQTPASFNWTVDTTAPDTQIDSSPPALTNSAAASFEFSGSDSGSGVASFQCRLDSSDEGAWAACTSPRNLSDLDDGAHTFEVRAIDNAGNTDQTPASFNWTVDSTAPDTQITKQPPALINSAAADFEFSGTDTGGSGVASFQCRIDSEDSEAWQACTSPKAYSELSDGNHRFEVRAIDQAGNADGSPASFEWTIDTATPPAPELTATVPASPANHNNPKILGTAPAGSTVRLHAGADCSGSPLATVSAAQLEAGVEVSVPDDSTTSFRATATTAAENTSGCSEALTYREDSTAPDTQIDSSPPALTNSAAASFEFSGTDSGSGIASFECRLDSEDSEDWTDCTSPRNLSDLEDGNHKFEVRAADNAGNTDQTPASFNWTVDSTAPDTTIDKAPPALTNSAAADFEFSGTDTGGSGVTSFQCRIDSEDSEAWQACTSPRNLSDLEDGAHTFEVRAIDNAGNADQAPASFNWTVDTTAPDTQIDSGPPALTNSAAASFEFSGSDSGSGIASFQCRIDSNEPDAWTDCTSPRNLSDLEDGNHQFEVRAIDNAGNTDQTPASFNWTVDTTAPAVSIDALSKDLLASGQSAELTWHADENGAFELRVGGTDCQSGAVIASGDYTTQPETRTSEVQAADLTEGQNTLRLCLTDAAGNRASATATIRKDTNAPDTQITKQPPALTNSASASFEFSGTDSGSGIASFECRLDSEDSEDWTDCTSPRNLSDLEDGNHKFEVRAVDNAGNTDQTPASFKWTIDTTAPDTQITKQPPALTNSAAASFEFSGTDGGSGLDSFECRLDSSDEGAWTDCTSPRNLSDLADGNHQFEVRAIDNAGNTDQTPASFNWTVDSTAPDTQITKQPPALINSAAADFEFSGTDTGGSGVASFECRIDSNEPGDWAACTSPRDLTDLSDGNHKFEVRAVDNAGNADGSPASFEWTVDTTAPETQINSGPAAFSATANASFAFSGSDAGGSGVASFQCRRDSEGWTPCTSPRNYSALAEGPHSFEVRAIDQAGNTDQTPASHSWVIDTISPDTQIDSSPPALTNSASASFEFSGTDSGSGSGVTSFECRIDSNEPDAWTDCTSPRNLSDLADGNHQFEVRAIDNAGNTDQTPASFNWTVDTTAPETQITKQPPALTNSAAASFEFSGTDGGSGIDSFECRLDSDQTADWAACTSPKAYSELSDGNHKFEVRAIDQAGNADQSPASFDWTVDTTAPNTQITKQPPALTNSASASFEFSGTDDGSGIASFQCRIDSNEPGDWAACTSPKAYADLSDGNHKFEVRAIDQAGNADGSPAAFEWTIDTATPPAPELTATVPASPANHNNPKILGTAPAGSTVRLHAGADCSGSPLATVSAAQLEAGVEVSVPDDSTTSFRATATTAAENTSGCSEALTYREDSTAPDTQIDSGPPALTNSAAASFEFSGSDSGSGIASFQCRIDSSDEGAWTDCTSPRNLSDLADGNHKFEVRAIDNAGNTDQTPASFNWTVDTTAPAVSIDALSKDLLASGQSAELTWHADENGAFELRVGGTDCQSGAVIASGDYTTQPETRTSEVQAADLTEGQNTLRLCLTDAAGNRASATATIRKDTNAPDTQITKQPPALTNSASASFEFSGTDSGSGIASFECRLDSEDSEDWTDCTSPRNLSDLEDGNHKFEVRAVDNAGNTDQTPASFKWTIDTATPPAPELTATVPASPANHNNPKILGTAPAGSTVRLYAGADCSGSPLATVSAAQLEAGVEVSVPDDSTTSFRATATTAAGNTSGCSEALTYREDSTAPDTQIDSGPPALTNSAAASFEFSGSDSGSGSGVTSFECRIDSNEPDAWTDCTSPRNLSDLEDGAHSFEVRAIDQAGNTDQTPASFNWTVDTTAPETQITKQPPALTNSTSASFEFSGTDDGSGLDSFECRLDSDQTADWAACTSPKAYSELSDGNHKFEVRAVDNAGNTDQSPASHNWTVDTTAPTVSIDSGPAGLTNDPTPTFAFSSPEAGVSFECSIDTGTPDFGPCSDPASHTPAEPLADGPYTFRVRATDTAENQATATRDFTVDTAAPPAPELTATVPASPANHNNPKILGTAPAGSTVRLHAGADCSGSPLATVSAAQLEAGVEVSVPDDSTTSFRATATTAAGNTSGCSEALTYREDSTAPDTQIDSSPPALTNSASASFEFSGTDSGSGIASFECRLDSDQASDWQACTSPRNLTELSDGAHTFEVRAIDNAGNTDQTPASFNWTVDTTAPETQINSGPPALTNSASASFEFSGTDAGGSGIQAFQCRLDSNEPDAWAACTSPRNLTELSDGAHKFEVRAVDQAGNADGSPASFEWTVDTTAPETQINSGPAAFSATANASFAFSGSDAGGSGVASFQCRRDSEDWTPCTSPRNYSALAEGPHSFEARAIDQAGNTDQTPASHSWVIDTISPDTQIDSSPPALTNSASASFEFSGGDSGSGIASFQCRVDSSDEGAWAACTSPRDLSDLEDGNHTFEVRAIDQAGNTDQTPASFNWSVDTTAPETQITKQPQALTNSAAASFEFSGTDTGGSGVASFECRIDSDQASDWQACISPRNLTELSDGAHTFEVRAIDQAGNTDQSPASHNWTVDTTAPAVNIDSGPTGLTNDPTPTFAFSSPEAGVSFECSIDTGTPDFGPCSDPASHTPAEPLADGPYTFRVRATDTAENQATATRDFTVDTAAPPAPELTATVPASPANHNNPKILGTAPAGSTVRLHAGADCSGSPLATVSAAQLEAGVEVSVPDDSTTSFRATATTAAGNTSGCSEALTYREDSTAPDSQIDANPPALTNSAAASFAFSGADAGGSGVASFQCRLDSAEPADWAACTSPRNLSGLSDGAHKLEVRAIDQAGNTDQSPASFEWTVDTTAPTTQIDSSPSALTNSAAASFAFSGADAGGSGVSSFQCRLDSSDSEDWAACTSPQGYSELADGAHKFEVRAIDTAGNTDQSPAIHNWVIDTIAPNTTIEDKPPALSNSAAATFTFSANDGGSGVDSFECRLDSSQPGDWAACASPEEYTSLAEGPHSFEVRATDQAGNADQSPATHSWSIDTAAPPAPELTATVPASPANHNNPKVTGSATAGTTVRLYSGADCTGAPLATVSAAELAAGVEVSVSDDSSTSFRATATTAAENTSGCSEALTYREDSTAPDTQIDSSTPALTNSAAASFEFNGSDPDGSGVASFECRIDSTEPSDWQACTSPRNLSDLADGNHKFEVRAIDNAGNTDQTPASFSWTVDTTAPGTQIDSSPPALTSSAAASFEFSGGDSGGSGIASFECRRDAEDWAPCASPRNYSALAEGSHSFEVRAIDQAGNTDQSPAIHNWVIDTIAPNTAIDSSPPALTNSAAATFTFSANDGGSGVDSFECRLDSSQPGDWAACASPKQYTGLAEGPHSFEVRATDEAGNTDQSPATHSWSIDTAAPPAPELTATVPASPANHNNPKVTGTAPAGTTVRLYTTADCSGPPLATATAAQLEAGIQVTVPDDTTTSFRATATTTADNTSVCSAPLDYIEDSSSPETRITSRPPAFTHSPAASFVFNGDDPSGSGVGSFQCRRDSEVWSPCTSPISYGSLTDGAHLFEVRAIDKAGNPDQSPSTHRWSIDTSVSAPPGKRPKADSAASAKFLRMRRNLADGTALLIFEVPGPGQLSARAPELALRSSRRGSKSALTLREQRLRLRRIRPSKIRITRGGRVKIPIRLARPGQKLLRQNRSLNVRVVVQYRSFDGSKATWKLRVNLKMRVGTARRARHRG